MSGQHAHAAFTSVVGEGDTVAAGALVETAPALADAGGWKRTDSGPHAAKISAMASESATRRTGDAAMSITLTLMGVTQVTTD